jgi:hypothetical protein
MNRLPKRILDSLTIIREDSCWLWTTSKKHNSYGNAWFEGKQWRAHRLIYTLIIGDIPEDMVLDHYRMNPGARNATCSKSCCNPEHLEVVTQKENVQRGRLRELRKGIIKTHCPKEHPYNKENTYLSPSGGKECRECRRLRRSRDYQKRKKKYG